MKLTKFISEHRIVLIIICVFILGWFSHSLITTVSAIDIEKTLSLGIISQKELNSPFNHIDKDQIHVYQDQIIIDIQNARWAEFTDTNSMDPVLDQEANSIEIIPDSVEDIHVGDIIAYKPNNFNGLIAHRVIDIDYDSQGWYAIAKGDNISTQDPGKIRFNQIEGVLVGIIY